MSQQNTLIDQDNCGTYQNRNIYENCTICVRAEELLNDITNVEVRFVDCIWKAVSFHKGIGLDTRENSVTRFPSHLTKVHFLRVDFLNKLVFHGSMKSLLFDSCHFSKGIHIDALTDLESFTMRLCNFQNGKIDIDSCRKVRELNFQDCVDENLSKKDKRIFISVFDSVLKNVKFQNVQSLGTCLVTNTECSHIQISFHNRMKNMTFFSCPSIGKVDIHADNFIQNISFKDIRKISEFEIPKCRPDFILIFDAQVTIDRLSLKSGHTKFLDNYHDCVLNEQNSQQYFHSMYMILATDLQNHYHPKESIRLTKSFLKYQSKIHLFTMKTMIEQSEKSDFNKSLEKVMATIRYFIYRFGFGILSGYGLSPLRMMVVNVAMIFVFSIIYYFSHILNGGFVSAMYFSGIIYTTIGMIPNDYVVSSGCELIIILEGVIGVLFLAYTMAVILEYTKRNSQI